MSQAIRYRLFHGCGQMNISGGEPTMTVAWVGNKSRVATTDGWGGGGLVNKHFSDLNPNDTCVRDPMIHQPHPCYAHAW